MSRNPILVTGSSAANLSKAETTIIAHLPSVLGKALIPINGKTMTGTQIVALLQGHLDAIATLDHLRAQTKTAVQGERTERATVKAAVVCIRNYIALAFGEQSTQFTSLGFVPRKQAVKSAEVKAQAVKKLRATREARHTMGSVQKSKIFGTVPAAPAPAVNGTTESALSTQSAGANGSMPAEANGGSSSSGGGGSTR
jgi:hypothetical protein